MKGMGIRVHTLREMEIFMEQHPELFDDVQAMWRNRQLFSTTIKEVLSDIPEIKIDDAEEYAIFLDDAYRHQDRLVNGVSYANTYNNFYIFDVDKDGFPTPKYQIPINDSNRTLISHITSGRKVSKADQAALERLGILRLTHEQRVDILSNFPESSRRNTPNDALAEGRNRGQKQNGRGINIFRADAKSNPNSKEYRRELARIRREIGEIISINNSLSSQEKSNIRNLLRAINRTGTTLLDDGDGTMYLHDHADREDIETRNRRHQDGFNCRLKFSINGYSKQEIDAIKKEIENGNIRDQESFDKWAKFNLNQQGRDNSDSIDAQVRTTNENNDRLDLQTSERRSDRRLDYQNSQGDLGTGYVKVYGNDGTNAPRYVAIGKNNSDIEFLKTPSGEVYGFAYRGEIYID